MRSTDGGATWEDHRPGAQPDGQLWESRDRGDTWSGCTLEGDALSRIGALSAA
jgi:hypothetical protein